VPGRNSHPAFGIESDRGRALEHGCTFFSETFGSLESVVAAHSAQTSHKTTLFHTGAHFRVRKQRGQAISGRQNANFANEMKDLARFLEAASGQKTSRNQGPSSFIEGAVSSVRSDKSVTGGKKLKTT
jgi:hypothetical protein